MYNMHGFFTISIQQGYIMSATFLQMAKYDTYGLTSGNSQ